MHTYRVLIISAKTLNEFHTMEEKYVGNGSPSPNNWCSPRDWRRAFRYRQVPCLILFQWHLMTTPFSSREKRKISTRDNENSQTLNWVTSPTDPCENPRAVEVGTLVKWLGIVWIILVAMLLPAEKANNYNARTLATVRFLFLSGSKDSFCEGIYDRGKSWPFALKENWSVYAVVQRTDRAGRVCAWQSSRRLQCVGQVVEVV